MFVTLWEDWEMQNQTIPEVLQEGRTILSDKSKTCERVVGKQILRVM
jgi:hypothetical protein